VAPGPEDEAKPKKSFFPEQVFKDTVAVFIAFAILFVMAAVVKVPLERLADPTDTSYNPRPEWYFLFLFQTLKILSGVPEVVGTVVLPTLAILALILAPFIDRGKIVRVRQRGLAAGIVLLAGLGWGGLTLAAIKGTPPPTAAEQIDFAGPIQWMQLAPMEMAGVRYFHEEHCDSCHNVTPGNPKNGPNLLDTANRHDAAWMTAHFQKNVTNLSDTQTKALIALMQKLTPDNGDVIDSAPDFAQEGAVIFQKNGCPACHKINGTGGAIGPPLNGLGNRRTEAWVVEHFQNPQKMSPKTSMPPYKFASPDMQNIVSYLFTLPDKAPGQ
jgi:mono/diheme cytochrome c family protein